MARVVRGTEPQDVALIEMHNELKDYVTTRLREIRADLVSIAANAANFATPALEDPGYHNDISERLVTAADGDDDILLAVTLVNDLTGMYKFHMSDTAAHKDLGLDLDSYDLVKLGDSGEEALTDALEAAIVQANAIADAYTLHIADTDLHYTEDTVDVVTEDPAEDQATLDLLLNELKAIFNAHMGSGVSTKTTRLVVA